MLKRFLCNKLIRDKLPEILSRQEIFVKTKSLNEAEILEAIKNKLIEEAKEVANSKNLEELTEEFADVFTVLDAIAKKFKISQEDIQKIITTKNSEKGAFDSNVFCEFIELDDSNPKIQYYLSKKDEYPEIEI